MTCRIYFTLLITVFAVPLSAQFDRTRLNITCPCELSSEDGINARVSFGFENHTLETVEPIYATVGISGERKTDSGTSSNYVAFVDTIKLTEIPAQQTSLDSQEYEINLGDIPEGEYFFELLLHENEIYAHSEVLDSVWFKGQHQAPISSLSLLDANYLVDSDGDDVDDINEELEGTDPHDPASQPNIPTIDALILYEKNPFEQYQTDATSFISHVLAATNSMLTLSESPLYLRAVGILDENDVPAIQGGHSLERAQLLELIEAYGADVVLTYRTRLGGICGFAATIGGWADKGFLHPNERFPYAEIRLEPSVCGIMVTAHELGHLMGLGHSFEQLSTGAYVWSRGHAVHGEFGTIMSYASQFFQATRIDVFSNPHLDCVGKPCGVSHTEEHSVGSADSALTLNILKYQFSRTSSPSSDFDFDGDGVSTVDDAFPIDPTEWADSDGDRFGDNRDAFPNDPLEWADTDGDGIGDNTDPDIDNDGVPNLTDADPFEAAFREPRFISLTSLEEGDLFGSVSTRINDVNGDGYRDLAVSAPSASNLADKRVGRVYLLSMTEVISLDSPENEPPGVKSVSDVVNKPDSWVLEGHISDGDFGRRTVFLEHEDASADLLIFSDSAFYLLTLNSETLAVLDAADGIEDRRLSAAYCVSTNGCIQVRFGEKKRVTEMASVGDLDNDGLTDIAFIAYSTDRFNQLMVYFMTRAGLVTDRLSEEERTIDGVLGEDSASFILTTAGIKGLGDLEPLGRSIERIENIALGVVDVESSGRVFVLDAKQLESIQDFDEDGDRRIDIESMLSANRTVRVIDLNDPRFGRSVNALTDIDGDGRKDLLVWASRDEAFAFSMSGLELHDQKDQETDGAIELNRGFEAETGTWRLVNLGIGISPHGSTVLSALNEESADLLATARFRSLFVAELRDLDYLDDPTGMELDGSINLTSQIRYPGIYHLLVPFGPQGRPTFSGVTSIGDIDDDNKVDFLFTVISEERDGTFSTLYVVYSSEIEKLDQADGDIDHIVMLHNNLMDIDGDGIPNIHDGDDDGDGLQDLRDFYPHLSQYQYDADRDGYANVLDAFPLDRTEHSDLDFDGVGDRVDPDIDGDGIHNQDDPFPYDTDDDGLANAVDPDDDNDSVLDPDDAFPLDPSESLDSDGDGVGDNSDAFVFDSTEWFDTDEDGIGNNADTDDDDDGYPDIDDAFPLLASEWLDTDGDGYGDNSDVFPLDPYEWEDKNGDGYGDNYGSESITSFRLVSDWYELDPSQIDLASAAVFSLGDIDRDDHDDLEISNALRSIANQSNLILSGAELSAMDALDGSSDQTIDIKLAHRTPMSYRFVDDSIGELSFAYSGATVGDLNADEELDLVFVDPLTNDYAGLVTLIYGGDRAGQDIADGEVDGQIDLSACEEWEWCVRMQSSHAFHGLGTNGRFVADLDGRDSVMLSVGTSSSHIRDGDDNGVASAYVLSDVAIRDAIEATTEDDLFVDTVTNYQGTWTFYAEPDPVFSEPIVGTVSVGRTLDLDRDNINELLIHDLESARVYVLASSDLSLMDSADTKIDQKIDLQNSYHQANSFKIEGFSLDVLNALSLTNYATQTRDGTSHFLPLLQWDEPYQMYLVDLRHLEDHDRADGWRNGVVSSFQAGSFNAWSFVDVDEMKICQADTPNGRVMGIASQISSDDGASSDEAVELTVFNVRDLKDLDRLDGASDGSINLYASIGQKSVGTWAFSFGSLADYTFNIDFECAGDFDGDDQQDIAISMSDQDDELVRTQIILISYRNLVQLDLLDGQQDELVDVSVLWNME